MQDEFDTNWDPYEHLIQCQENINQLAIAFNGNSGTVQELNRALRHQQEVIQQLVLQNRKLTDAVKITTVELNQIKNDLAVLKSQN